MIQRIDEKKKILTLDQVTISKEEATDKALEMVKKHKALMDYLKDK